MRKEKYGIRWDKVIGLLTLVAIMVLAIMIYIDFKPDKKAEQTDGNVVTDTESITQKSIEETTVDTKVTVCIDAGHGAEDAGANVGTTYEKTQVLDVALKVQKELESSGVHVVMTRTTDVNLSKQDRVNKCNAANAVAMISIHRNYYDGVENVYGAEAWINSTKPKDAEILANSILSKLYTYADEDNRGVKYGTAEDGELNNYYINANSKCASCILELGFITSPYDTALVTTNIDVTAKAIADGILEYLRTMEYING